MRLEAGSPKENSKEQSRLNALILKSDELAGKRGQRIIPGGLTVLNSLNTTKYTCLIFRTSHYGNSCFGGRRSLSKRD